MFCLVDSTLNKSSMSMSIDDIDSVTYVQWVGAGMSIPKMSTPIMSIPKMSIPMMSTVLKCLFPYCLLWQNFCSNNVFLQDKNDNMFKEKNKYCDKIQVFNV